MSTCSNIIATPKDINICKPVNDFVVKIEYIKEGPDYKMTYFMESGDKMYETLTELEFHQRVQILKP